MKLNFYLKKEWNDAILLLRLPFSIFLLPVFLFALVFLPFNTYNYFKVLVIFFVLHLGIYPASNGYNSYFDKDTESIGGLAHPPQPNQLLLFLVNVLDVLSVLISFFLSPWMGIWALGYIAASRAYSGPIRLKKYPILSTGLVTGFQGAGVFFLVWAGLNIPIENVMQTILAALGSTFFLMGAYPLTQIYQHEPDAARGDLTLSRMLGIKGTFVFSAVAFALGGAVINWCLFSQLGLAYGLLFGVFALIPLSFFIWWWQQCLKHKRSANFKNAMRMNIISSLSLSASYLLMLIWKSIP